MSSPADHAAPARFCKPRRLAEGLQGQGPQRRCYDLNEDKTSYETSSSASSREARRRSTRSSCGRRKSAGQQLLGRHIPGASHISTHRDGCKMHATFRGALHLRPARRPETRPVDRVSSLITLPSRPSLDSPNPCSRTTLWSTLSLSLSLASQCLFGDSCAIQRILWHACGGRAGRRRMQTAACTCLSLGEFRGTPATRRNQAASRTAPNVC